MLPTNCMASSRVKQICAICMVQLDDEGTRIGVTGHACHGTGVGAGESWPWQYSLGPWHWSQYPISEGDTRLVEACWPEHVASSSDCASAMPPVAAPDAKLELSSSLESTSCASGMQSVRMWLGLLSVIDLVASASVSRRKASTMDAADGVDGLGLKGGARALSCEAVLSVAAWTIACWTSSRTSTDHKNLEYYHHPCHINHQVVCYIPQLADYNFTLVHFPGTANKADTLSKCPDYPQGSKDNDNVTVLPPHLFACATSFSSIDDRTHTCQLQQPALLKQWATTFLLKVINDLFWYGD
jgi:hypothetical protein